jgi:hypothetical protein
VPAGSTRRGGNSLIYNESPRAGAEQWSAKKEHNRKLLEESLWLTRMLAEEAEKDRQRHLAMDIENRERAEQSTKLTKISTILAQQSLELAKETRRDSRTMRGIG